MVGSHLLAFKAKMECLYDMLAFIREEARLAGFDPQVISKIELAAEEALVNVITYAYGDREGEAGPIDIECKSLEEGGILIFIRDNGVPYNPLQNKDVYNPKNPQEEHSVGGYGIFFILNLMDKVTYSFENGSNVLMMTKYHRSPKKIIA